MSGPFGPFGPYGMPMFGPSEGVFITLSTYDRFKRQSDELSNLKRDLTGSLDNSRRNMVSFVKDVLAEAINNKYPKLEVSFQDTCYGDDTCKSFDLTTKGQTICKRPWTLRGNAYWASSIVIRFGPQATIRVTGCVARGQLHSGKSHPRSLKTDNTEVPLHTSFGQIKEELLDELNDVFYVKQATRRKK